MAGLFFFDEVVTASDNAGNKSQCSVEVVDLSSIPEVRIGPVDHAYAGHIAEFDNWEQFERFVDAVNDLHRRLEGFHKK